MINGKQFKMVTDKFMSSPTVQNARVQVCLPNGEFYDIKGIQLMENKCLSYLYEGYKIEELDARGLELELVARGSMLAARGLRLWLEA
jgi:hypothetical protein